MMFRLASILSIAIFLAAGVVTTDAKQPQVKIDKSVPLIQQNAALIIYQANIQSEGSGMAKLLSPVMLSNISFVNADISNRFIGEGFSDYFRDGPRVIVVRPGTYILQSIAFSQSKTNGSDLYRFSVPGFNFIDGKPAEPFVNVKSGDIVYIGDMKFSIPVFVSTKEKSEAGNSPLTVQVADTFDANSEKIMKAIRKVSTAVSLQDVKKQGLIFTEGRWPPGEVTMSTSRN
jgi:hypothetical protein